MCCTGVVWPQTMSWRVRPKTAAMRSRSSGLGVQRPRMMAATWPSSRPDFAASWRLSRPCSAHSCSTRLSGSMVVLRRGAGDDGPIFFLGEGAHGLGAYVAQRGQRQEGLGDDVVVGRLGDEHGVVAAHDEKERLDLG